ncbi:MAG: cytochrome C oxidase subunit IV family protein [bacterium]|nr:cytochrome C oxidase subunit IV family protein [bacterium]
MAGHSDSHVHPVSLYTRTLYWLMVLLVLTVVAGYIPNVPNWLGVVIALTIAVWKATIVIMNFMHVRFSGKLAWLFAGAGFFWLIIMLAFAFADYVSRPWEPFHGWSE